jgi:hypothetical protein
MGTGRGGLCVCCSLLESKPQGASTLPLIHQDWMTLRVIWPSLFLISFHLIASPYIVIIPFVCLCVYLFVCLSVWHFGWAMMRLYFVIAFNGLTMILFSFFLLEFAAEKRRQTGR